MGGISKVTEQFAVTVKSCHLCSHLNLHIISAKSKGMRTYRYTFYYKRKLKTVNFENINLNLIKLKTQIQMSRFLPHLRANLIASGSPFSEHLFPVCSTCPLNQFFSPSLCVLDGEADMEVKREPWVLVQTPVLKKYSVLEI